MKSILQSGVIAVLRSDSIETCEKTAEAVLEGGIKAVEITMTAPGALGLIERLSAKLDQRDGIVIGAGTVLDPETARLCILAGARYIVTPALNVETIKLCNRYAVAVIPGIMTVTEAITAMEYGCAVLKLFPCGIYGPSVINALHGPLPQAEFIPTGGVGLQNAGEWIRAGAAAVGVGTDLTHCAGDYTLVARRAELLRKAVEAAREKEQQ
jgi:2-dehydro-3-deoxyphosphogluconate aldolase/(4S)-4-hydroxy-2-oxoglutarate aldolase